MSSGIELTIMGDVELGRTVAELCEADSGSYIGSVYEELDGWKHDIPEEHLSPEILAAIEEAKCHLRLYVNRKGENAPPGLTAAGFSLWLLEKTDGTAAPTNSTAPACANCGRTFEGRFCPSCGQDREEGVPSVGHWVREVFSELTSFEARLWRSLVALVARPGVLTKAWLEGKRQFYTRPIRLFLLALLVVVGQAALMDSDDRVLTEILSGLFEGLGADHEQVDQIPSVVSRGFRWFGLAMVPVTACILGVLFRRRPFAGHLVFVLHIFAFVLLLYVLMLVVGPVAKAILGEIAGTFVPLAGLVLVLLTYSYRALRTVYHEGVIGTSVKLLAAFVMTMVVWLGVAAAWVGAVAISDLT